MPKSLIITEKPSVASDIAKAVGGFKKGKDYYENEKYVISWAVGHLFELAVPASMKDQDKWDMKKLPIMPAEFALEPAEKMTGRANVLRKLIRNIFVSDELAKNIGATGHFLRGLEREFRRHNRQLLHVPFVLVFHRSRDCEFK